MHLDLLSIPQSGGKNVKTFRWDQQLKIQKYLYRTSIAQYYCSKYLSWGVLQFQSCFVKVDETTTVCLQKDILRYRHCMYRYGYVVYILYIEITAMISIKVDATLDGLDGTTANV